MRALVLIAFAAPVLAQVPPETAAVQRCRIIAESAARLACYDAIALPGLGSRAGWGAPVAGAAVPAAAPAAAATTAPGGTFGLERQIADSAPDRLESRIVGSAESFGNGTRFTLENGQIWQVNDNVTAYYPQLANPKVTITRGVLGSFYMVIDGVAQSPRVRRVQ